MSPKYQHFEREIRQNALTTEQRRSTRVTLEIGSHALRCRPWLNLEVGVWKLSHLHTPASYLIIHLLCHTAGGGAEDRLKERQLTREGERWAWGGRECEKRQQGGGGGVKRQTLWMMKKVDYKRFQKLIKNVLWVILKVGVFFLLPIDVGRVRAPWCGGTVQPSTSEDLTKQQHLSF